MAAKCHPLPIETRAIVIELSKAGKSERQIAIEDFFSGFPAFYTLSLSEAECNIQESCYKLYKIY